MLAQTQQPYAFTGGDPLNLSDPLGLRGWYCIFNYRTTSSFTSHYFRGTAYGTANGRCGSSSGSSESVTTAQTVAPQPRAAEPSGRQAQQPSTSRALPTWTPPAPTTGRVTEVPSQIEAHQSRKQVTNLCRVGLTLGGTSGIVAGGERISSSLGSGLENFGRTLDQTGQESGPPSDGLGYAMLVPGVLFLAVGGAMAYFGNHGSTCS